MARAYQCLAAVEVIGAGILRGFLGDDENRADIKCQGVIWRSGFEAHRVWIDGLFADDLFGIAGKWPGTIGQSSGTVQREHYIFRRQFRAVTEFDALAQLELPGQRVDGLPRCCQARNQMAIGVDVYQCVDQMRRQRYIRRDVVEMRIECRDVGI